MDYRSKIIADSCSSINGCRVTTVEFDIWKPLLAEFNTHGLQSSRNFPSSRAIPWAKMREKILKTPHVPMFRKNNPGMQPGEPLSASEQKEAETIWLEMRDFALEKVEILGSKDGLNIHKQWLNRNIESWIVVPGLVTATHWTNFFNLRTELNDSGYPMAQDEFYFQALAMLKAINESTPKELKPGEWHLPYIDDEAKKWPLMTFSYEGADPTYYHDLAYMSAGRCATISYDNLGAGVDHEKDYKRATDQLRPFGHMSVFQHQARCMEETWGDIPSDDWIGSAMVKLVDISNHKIDTPTNKMWWGQLCGWGQFRKIIPNEACWVSPNANKELALSLPELFTN